MPSRKIVRFQSTTTFSSIVGNITSFATEFIKGRFPTNFFKDIIISEELLNRRIDEDAVQKYQLPLLLVKPELALDDTSLQTLPRWYIDNHYIAAGNNRRNYYPILRDEEHAIYIHCIPTRVKINFNLTIKVQTMMYMYNVIQYLTNTFEKQGYEYLNGIRLQTEIPKNLIKVLSKSLEYNLNNTEGRENFANYLYKNSLQGIEEKISLSTGNSIYNFTYIVNILSNYPDVSQGNKNVKGLIVDDCTITFPFSLEFWIPNKFILEIPDMNIDIQESFMEEPVEAGKYKYNIVLDTHYIMPKIENRHLLVKCQFLPDVNDEYDELTFSSLINRELNDTLNILKKENTLTEKIFEVRVMCGNKFLPRDLFTVDYNAYKVYTKYPMKNTTYTILIYGDLEYLNQVAEAATKKRIQHKPIMEG